MSIRKYTSSLGLKWKMTSPKWAKVIGKIMIGIIIIGMALSYAYTDLPEELQSILPEKLGIISAIGGFFARLGLQFTVIKELYNNDKRVLSKHKNRK